MELARIENDAVVLYPVSRENCEAAIIAAQPATVTIEQTVYEEDEDGQPVPKVVLVEIDNHPEFCLPADLAGVDLSDHGFAVVEPVETPDVEPGEVAERDGIEEYAPGKWRWKWLIRSATPDEFTAHEAGLHRAIDDQAGAFRKQFITDVPGQQQTYAEKEAEARSYQAGGAAGPFLTAEAAARGIPIADVAAEIIATADFWRGLAALIEAHRIAAKRAVTAARLESDWPAMDAAASVDWESLIP